METIMREIAQHETKSRTVMVDSLFFNHLWGAFHVFDWSRMSKTPLSRVAEAIMTQHIGTSPDTLDVGAAARRVHAMLITNLSFFLGESGSVALMRRGLRRTQETLPWLATLRETEPHDLVNAFGLCLDEQAPDMGRKAAVLVLTSVLELRATLIGVELTLQVVRGTWPDVRLPTSTETRK
jgi:hypothetical protein